MFEDAHGSEAYECTADAVDKDCRSAAEHGSEQYTDHEYAQDIAGPRQGVEGNEGDEVGQSKFGTWSEKGHGNHPLKDEQGQGLGDEQAQINKFGCRIHAKGSLYSGLFYGNDVRSRGIICAFELNHELMRQADNDFTRLTCFALAYAELIWAVCIVDGNGIIVDHDVIVTREILDVYFIVSMVFGELYLFLQAAVNGDLCVNVMYRYVAAEDGERDKGKEKTAQDECDVRFFDHSYLFSDKL